MEGLAEKGVNCRELAVRIRLSKAKRKAGYWFDKYENKFVLAETPRKFYDYNF